LDNDFQVKYFDAHFQVRTIRYKMISTIDILSALSDDKALILFSTIALGKCYDFKTLIKRMGITQSQYYFRLRRITNMGLVKRKNGKYRVTTLGNVVYEAVGGYSSESLLGSKCNRIGSVIIICCRFNGR